MDNKSSGTITKEEIKKILINHYNKKYGGEKIDRELVVLSPEEKKEFTRHKNCYCYFFALAGSPPKGYGIYISFRKVLCLYDLEGKRFKEYYLDKGIEGIDYFSG